jgi:hypothetical protein
LENTLERGRGVRLEGETEREAEEIALPGKASVEFDREARENILPTNEFARDEAPFIEFLPPFGNVIDLCELDQRELPLGLGLRARSRLPELPSERTDCIEREVRMDIDIERVETR